MSIHGAARAATTTGAVLLLLGALTGCASLGKSFETPKVRLTDIRFVEAGLLEQRYGLTLRVQNPNNIAMPVRGMSYEIRLAGSEFASGVTPEAFSVPAYGETEFQVEVSTNLISAVRQLARVLQDRPDNLDYEMSGRIQVDLPLVGALPFSHSGTLDLSGR